MLLRNITSATAGDPSPFHRFYGVDYHPFGLLPFGARVSLANKNASKSKLSRQSSLCIMDQAWHFFAVQDALDRIVGISWPNAQYAIIMDYHIHISGYYF